MFPFLHLDECSLEFGKVTNFSPKCLDSLKVKTVYDICLLPIKKLGFTIDILPIKKKYSLKVKMK